MGVLWLHLRLGDEFMVSSSFQASVLQGARVGASVAAIRAAVLPVHSVQGLRGGHHDDEASYNEGPLQRTLSIIKPDAVAAGNEDNIKQAILDHGFKIVAEKKIQLTKKQVCSKVLYPTLTCQGVTTEKWRPVRHDVHIPLAI
jgi:hypothetical protein